MKKFVCGICGYVYEGMELRKNVLSAALRKKNSRKWLPA